LEFDIGFLRPWDRKRVSACAAALFELPAFDHMAFGIPETELSRQVIVQKRRKYRQLDILVFGMPKILPEFF
jgi:hypothetical protein